MRRKPVSRSASAATFRRTANRTRSINIYKPTMARGGFRL